jgi:hypothetical protein
VFGKPFLLPAKLRVPRDLGKNRRAGLSLSYIYHHVPMFFVKKRRFSTQRLQEKAKMGRIIPQLKALHGAYLINILTSLTEGIWDMSLSLSETVVPRKSL